MSSGSKLRRLGERVTFSADPIGTYAPTRAQRATIEVMRRLPLKFGAITNYASLALMKLRNGPVDYEYLGAPMRFYPTRAASARHMLLTPGITDADEIGFLVSRLPEAGSFVDIGSNSGLYLFAVAIKRPDVSCLGIEPMPKHAEVLAYNIKAANLANVQLAPVALADTDGTARLGVDSESITHGDGSVAVPTRRLDGLLKSHGFDRIDAMKIDVEGAEDRVLVPFFNESDRHLWPKAIIMEESCRDHWKTDCITFLKDRGYVQALATKLNIGLELKN